MKKLVLIVIDAMKPAMLERAAEAGRVPTLKALMDCGHSTDELIAAFPSVTPVCSASIATGAGPDEHNIPAMNWYHREERRYVEYGTSFRASQAFGLKRSLTDTIYKMNAEHLSAETPTVFEMLDDAGVRTAGTTYLMYRGRHEHPVSDETALTRIARGVFRDAVLGPKEFFYADMFASRKTPCRSQLGLPGVRDQHAGCVGEFLVENDLCDFLLLSLPDNDTHSHKNGPYSQVASLAAADKQIERMMLAAGGVQEFLEGHAVIVCSDHSQSLVEQEIDLFEAFKDFHVLPAAGHAKDPEGIAEIALCPNSRSATVYTLDDSRRRRLQGRIVNRLVGMEGIDLVLSLTDHPDGEASVRSEHGELRFMPGGDLRDDGGRTWSVEGDHDVLALRISDGRLATPLYPDALNRAWSALRCPTMGQVVVSAAPGYEFLDWGRAHHVGGGSHGSLHAVDSNGSLIWCGVGPDSAEAKEQWTLRDIAPMIRGHFGLG